MLSQLANRYWKQLRKLQAFFILKYPYYLYAKYVQDKTNQAKLKYKHENLPKEYAENTNFLRVYYDNKDFAEFIKASQRPNYNAWTNYSKDKNGLKNTNDLLQRLITHVALTSENDSKIILQDMRVASSYGHALQLQNELLYIQLRQLSTRKMIVSKVSELKSDKSFMAISTAGSQDELDYLYYFNATKSPDIHTIMQKQISILLKSVNCAAKVYLQTQNQTEKSDNQKIKLILTPFWCSRFGEFSQEQRRQIYLMLFKNSCEKSIAELSLPMICEIQFTVDTSYDKSFLSKSTKIGNVKISSKVVSNHVDEVRANKSNCIVCLVNQENTLSLCGVKHGNFSETDLQIHHNYIFNQELCNDKNYTKV